MDLKGPGTAEVTGRFSNRVSDDQYFVDSVSSVTRPLERIIVEIAPTDIPVLILGESGSGKEVTAQRIHRLSRRGNEPLAKMMCANLSVKDLDQLLAGEKTAGTVERLCNAGTVFFDEVSDLEPACQPKLLHALRDSDTVPDDNCIRARVICSSRRNLEEEIRKGRFREELYYRLNGVCLRLPPLRRRKEDIPALVDFFLRKYSGQLGRPKPSFSSNTMSRLLDYHWPGNIRQLENAVRNIVALGDEGLALGDLELIGAELSSRAEAHQKFSLKEAARAASHQAERELILKTLQRTRWNRKRAAQELQISYKALLYKLKQIGMEGSAESSDFEGHDL
jgi:two-component system response regulator AtoC